LYFLFPFLYSTPHLPFSNLIIFLYLYSPIPVLSYSFSVQLSFSCVQLLFFLCSTSPFPVLPFHFFIFRLSCTVLHSFLYFTSPYHALSNSDFGSLQYCSLKQNRGRNFRLSLNCPITHSVQFLNQFNSRNYRRRPIRNELGKSFSVCLKMCTTLRWRLYCTIPGQLCSAIYLQS